MEKMELIEHIDTILENERYNVIHKGYASIRTYTMKDEPEPIQGTLVDKSYVVLERYIRLNEYVTKFNLPTVEIIPIDSLKLNYENIELMLRLFESLQADSTMQTLFLN